MYPHSFYFISQLSEKVNKTKHIWSTENIKGDNLSYSGQLLDILSKVKYKMVLLLYTKKGIIKPFCSF